MRDLFLGSSSELPLEGSCVVRHLQRKRDVFDLDLVNKRGPRSTLLLFDTQLLWIAKLYDDQNHCD